MPWFRYVMFNTKKSIAYAKNIYNIKLIHESLYKYIPILNNSTTYHYKSEWIRYTSKHIKEIKIKLTKKKKYY